MDPITLSPVRNAPTRQRLVPSPSPPRSPSQRQHFTSQDLNPLLSDPSPSSTLEVLQANDLVQRGGKADNSFLQESVATASPSERAWGIKAALAGKRVREWHAEIEGWAWPGFDQPLLEGPTTRRTQYRHEGYNNRSLSTEAIRFSGNNPTGKKNTGLVSSMLIKEYEECIEIIRDGMETLEIEDLKDYVRNAHFKAGSRRSSLQDPRASFALVTDYDHLDDFTAVITAIIVRALPTISRLETLLTKWSTRLLVLRQVPFFLADFDAGRESMVSALIAIGAHNVHNTKRRLDFSRQAFSDIRAVLQDQIAELGRRLDRMLDLLEGSVDTLPDAWIDGLDNMETQYSAWVVRAERLAINKELRSGRLEKDYTQDHPDELLGLDSPLDIRPSTLDIGAHLDEIRRPADSDYDLAGQAPAETQKSENTVPESLTKTSAGNLQSLPSREALLKQDLGINAQPRGQVVESVDRQPLNGLSDGQETSSLPNRSSHRPTPLISAGSRANVKRSDSSDAASDGSGSGSRTSNYSSNKSSPEIQSAVVAEYIGSPSRVTSPALSNKEPMTPLDLTFRKSSQRLEDDEVGVHQTGVPLDLMSKKRASNGGPGQVRPRSASIRSFEIVPKHEIRRIQVQRSGSHSSTFSLSDPEYCQVPPSRLPTSSAPQHGEREALRITTSLPVSGNMKDQQLSASAQNGDPGFDMRRPKPLYHPPPPVSVKSSMITQSATRELHTPKQKLPYHTPPAIPPRPTHPVQSLNRELEVAKRRSPYHSPPPIPPRSAHRFEQVSDLGPGSAPVEIRRMNMSTPINGHAAGPVETPRATAGLSPSNFEDQLEKRISSILTELPTQIRLTSGPEPDAPEVPRFNSSSNPRTPNARSPAWRLRRSQASTPLPSMTLAPAQPKSSQSRPLTGEPDIKLYHLHQAGKTAPIKLFVRLVGEGGERVMVRIGGGWADLGEYLREYAGHHGRRSVSDTPFDITGLPSSSPLTNNQSPRSRPGSRPDTPTSSSTKHSPANRLARQQTSSAMVEGPHTPHSDPSSRPSPLLPWTGTDDASPSLGLAGPRTKNVDISPSKQAWVDEMMELARHGGAEKSGGGGDGAVGDLGTVGSTRRIFFKSRKEG